MEPKSVDSVGGECEVYLSFSGLDTRRTFTDFLYICLEDVGVRTFRDDEMLRKGEGIGDQLFQAIRESKISIPIFSKNYASSQWCLGELALMVECKRKLGQLILPIFYDVEPSEVRHQSGVYKEAFRMHKNHFDERTVNQWKEALKEVVALKGWIVKTHADGRQGKLIKEAIVPTVLLELRKNQMDSETGPSTVFHSSSTSVVGGQYEVFLNFSGPDTRYTFTDFLYTYLEDVGVRTFRDNNELRRGENIGPELLKVIMESKISIPIFSRNYASSKWCLRELAQMVECRRTMGQLILPIFYDVEPSDVWRQSGSYEEAFQEHMKNYDERTVKEWKEALIEVANTQGWVLSDVANGLQGKFIKKIVQTVMQHLEKHKLAIPDNLVGIDDHAKEIITLLDLGSNDTRIVGIHGVGGIGKTTIAKFMYNELLKYYECCSFLADVREMAQQPNGLVRLQEQFFHDTVKCSPAITEVNDGIDLIKSWFFNKKVLIVLDNVNEKSQFDCLVGNRDWFGQGSRIIVTTRDEHLLNALKVDETYETPRMNSVQSLQLFSIHAFGKKFPPTDYDSISREITSIFAGIPLALEVMASFLSGKSLYDWKVVLQELKVISSDELIKKLAISYDGLNDTQQQIFLDIACHFIGMDKTYAIYMWDDRGYLTEKEINALCRRRLVKLGDDNVLRMHDLFRDFGREIVRQENFMDLGKRSRLWNHKEAFDVLVKQMGTTMVETLSLHSAEKVSQSRFTNVQFKNLVNLRYLQMDGADLVGDFEHLFPQLRWLSWHRCPLQFKPTNFHLKNLVILDLSHSGITEDWEGWNQIKMAKKLKVLDLSFCALTRTPDFSTYATLEKLIIRSCKNLVEIDSSIVHLKNLEVVDLSGSFNLEKLPDEILMFVNPEEISKYEVFLSFTGPDTFTDFLYHHLNGLRVRTFPDDNELPKGEEIRPKMLKAIKESKISIPIFSQNYASSKRCLRELAQMVECKRTMGQVILPIFYDVKPWDVQCLSGGYKEAFYEHERCFSDGTVNKWKEALREVGALKGWEVKNESNEYQQKLINEMIVPAVLLELKKNSMIGTDFLVGINRHQNEMMKILDVDSNEVRIIGIYGMGGIGKTTITKIVYDILFESFDYHSFLADVGGTAQQFNGLVDLQKKLLTDTLKWCPDISDADSGMDVIKHAFLGKKVLVVLDDVIESSQFFSLVGKRDWFGSGSRIIVTSKDRNVLNALRVDEMYEPPLMNFVQSLQLFSIHAFRRRFPPKGYVNVSKEVASAAAGLPLTLEVMGSLLSIKEKVVWQDTLKKLKKISHYEVESKLRVSYEALSHAQRQIFLDIACFFTGTDKATVFYMWDDCGYHPEKEFNVLHLMSLVKVERDTNELRMHDEFRTLGRKIVYEEKILGNRSRLWNHDDALDVLEGRRGTEKVEALSLCFDLGSGKKPRFASKEFAKLISLRYLRADGIELVGDFKHLFANLRWLCWHGCPPHFKPTNFHLKNLVILDLSDSGITENWGGWNQIKMANKLKILRLADCALRRTPDFSSYATLEILILRRCRNLVKIDRSIGDLKNLKVLDISYADIRELPVEIQELKKLKVIGFKY